MIENLLAKGLVVTALAGVVIEAIQGGHTVFHTITIAIAGLTYAVLWVGEQ